MLTFLRRIINSRVGVIVAFGLLIIIALAFAAGDVTGLSGSGGVTGGSVAKVGGESVGSADLRKRAQDEVRRIRTQQPTFDLAQFVSTGGVESLVQRAVNGLALQEFGREQGMAVSRALIGSELRQISAFHGPTGQFDQQTYQRAIAQAGMTDAQIQREVARETMAQFLMVPTVGAAQVPEQLALPYASLLLERRVGQVALIPAAALPAPAAPSDAEVSAWYRRNVARYTVPERRVMRYAIVTPVQVKAQATPSDAEIAAIYNQDRATYAAREQRDLTLVTVLDQKAAQALAQRIRGGTPIAQAARAAGLDARVLTNQEKAAIAGQTTPAAANALFAAPAGSIVGPQPSSIGFVVGRVDKVTPIAARPLAQVRDEIAARLATRKTSEALAKASGTIEDALADNATFAEVAADNKLTAQVTQPLLANGTQFNVPKPPEPALAPVVTAGFAAEEGDTPTLVPTGQDGGFAVVALERVIRAAPLPLEQVRARVLADIAEDRRSNAARTIARSIAAKTVRGVSLATALRESGLKVPPPQPLASTRAQLNAGQNGANPVLAMLFSLPQGGARAIASPENRGWVIVKADQVVPGDARKQPGVIRATRADIGNVIGTEYAQQFANAVAAHVGVKRNADTLAQLKKDLAGQGAGDQ